MRYYFTAKQVKVGYQKQPLIEKIEISLEKGKILTIIGPNGAGKTTAFNCITGVYEPTNGRVDFMGEPIVCNHPRGKMKKTYAGEHAERYLSLPVVSYTPDKITKRGIERSLTATTPPNCMVICST